MPVPPAEATATQRKTRVPIVRNIFNRNASYELASLRRLISAFIADGRDCDDRAVGDDVDFLAGRKAERGQPFPI